MTVVADNGRICFELPANSGEILVPADICNDVSPANVDVEKIAVSMHNTDCPNCVSSHNLIDTLPDRASDDLSDNPDVSADKALGESTENVPDENISQLYAPDSEEILRRTNANPECASIEELQCAILSRMAGNGPVTDQMRRTVIENTHHGSLVNWLRSFR